MPDTPTRLLRVGWVEAGNPLFMGDHDRSAPRGTFAPLLAMPGIEWVDLSEAADRARGAKDFADTAALVASLDLVITVDTAMFHLAASLGVQTWMIPMTSPTWFCGLNDSTRTPWYGGWHKLYRRTRVDAWDECVERVKVDLSRLRKVE